MGSQVTVADDDWVRSHDEARELFRYTVPGATVVVEPLEGARDLTPQTRRITLVLDAAPDFATACQDLYVLPFLGRPMQARVRALAERGWEALRRHRLKE